MTVRTRPSGSEAESSDVPALVALPTRGSPADARPPTLIAAQPWTTRQRFYLSSVKPLIDFVLTLLLLLPGLPLMGAIALAIRLTSHGPIFYRQERVGLQGRPFMIYKFCTMVPDRRVNHEPIAFPERRRRHKSDTDPRVTRIGSVLRRTSLDELPQLFNVLRGEMSLVGPRPEMPAIVAKYEPWQHERHLVRPGITGWWQINGRSDLPMHENTDLDIEYVRRVSFTFDLRILLQTARAVLRGSGAF